MTVHSFQAQFAQANLAKLGAVRLARTQCLQFRNRRSMKSWATRNSTHDGHTHWSARMRTGRSGISAAQVQRIRAARGVSAAFGVTFKLSNNPQLAKN